jgi:hypothetical protein
MLRPGVGEAGFEREITKPKGQELEILDLPKTSGVASLPPA